MLSPEQQYAFAKFKKGENIFVTGPGGTGKTKLIQHLYKESLLDAKKKLQICSLTGCSALLLGVSAKTIHSWSGIKIAKGTQQQVVDSVVRSKKLVAQWRKTKILVVDEVSMLSQKIFEILDKIGRIVHKNPLNPFGGMQIIFTGDFFQLAPVGSPGEPDTAKFCFESPIWHSVFPAENHIVLKTIFRQNDPVFIHILSEVRQGELSEESKKRLQERVGRDMSNLGDIVPTKLFAIRSKADYINNLMFSKIEEKEYVFESIRKINCKTYFENGDLISGGPIPADVLAKCHRMTPGEQEYEITQLLNNIPCSPIFSLKKGSLVMCTVNIDMESGICNGSCGTVVDIIESPGNKPIPMVKFTNGIIKQFQPYYWQSDEFPTIAVGNIPLMLSWAMTIHKSQGASLEYAQLDLGNTIFADGQTYVGLSRVRSLEGLYLSALNPARIRANPLVQEFYKGIKDREYTDIESIIQDVIPKKDFSEFAYQEPVSTVKKIIIGKPTINNAFGVRPSAT